MSDILMEAVNARTKAYWLSPSAKFINVDSTHIDVILKNPKVFNLDVKEIDAIAKKHGGKQELRDGGKARDEIMTNLLKQGWVRIRKVEARGNEFWTIQLETGMGTRISGRTKNVVVKWAEKMYNLKPSKK